MLRIRLSQIKGTVNPNEGRPYGEIGRIPIQNGEYPTLLGILTVTFGRELDGRAFATFQGEGLKVTTKKHMEGTVSGKPEVRIWINRKNGEGVEVLNPFEMLSISMMKHLVSKIE